jgi:hypothetical protein
MLDEGFDLRFECVERSPEAMVTGKGRIDDREAWTQEPSPCAREEHGDAEAVRGDPKAMRAWDTFDNPMEAKPAQVVRHAAAGELSRVDAQQLPSGSIFCLMLHT